jgi:type IV secretion system protein VirB2
MVSLKWKMKSQIKTAAVVVGALIALQIVGSDVAYAATGSTAFAPIQTAVQMVVDFIQGPFGRLCAIIAVMGLGFLAFAGRLSWFTAGAVVLGIGFVFGAPSLVDSFISSVGGN